MNPHDVNTGKDFCGLQVCLRHAMRLCRWTGYFPVQGLDQHTADGTKFKVKCLYSIYHILTIIGQTIMTCFSLICVFDNNVTLSSITNFVFYVTGLISGLLFIRLAHQWPKLMKKAEQIEQSLIKLKMDKSVIKNSSIIAYVIMMLALVEHILCTNFNLKYVMECLHETRINSNVMENYVMHRMPHIFNYISYSAFKAALAEVYPKAQLTFNSICDSTPTEYFDETVLFPKSVSEAIHHCTDDKILCLQATFIWSFTDVMTICFSIYIISYLKNLNKIMWSKNNSVSWRQLREHYTKIVVLVKEIDAQLSSFILLSFFTDLFFICLQLFNSLHRNYTSIKNCGEEETAIVMSSPDYLLYYLYSFLFLVLRALSLALFAANVHSAAQEPIICVYEVPSSDYDQEVHRFQLQLRFTKVALSGQFFHVTRSMVLQAIGTIITYELVLLQFSIKPDTTTSAEVIMINTTTI